MRDPRQMICRRRALFWTLLLLIGAAWRAPMPASAAEVPTAKPPLHTFTDSDGKSLAVASIATVVNDTVFLKPADGAQIQVKIGALSADDQKFVQEWIVQSALAQKDGVFHVAMLRAKSGEAQVVDNFPASKRTTTTWVETCNFKLKNLTTYKWTNLLVRYVLIEVQAPRPALPPDNVQTFRFTGTVKLDELNPTDETQFSTDKVDMRQISSQLKRGGAPTVRTDEIKAVWLRIYAPTGEMLFEWSSNPAVTKGEFWDAAWGTRGRGRGARQGAAAQ